MQAEEQVTPKGNFSFRNVFSSGETGESVEKRRQNHQRFAGEGLLARS